MNKTTDDYWQRYTTFNEQARALRTLQLTSDASHYEITRSYRKLISRHHPDKGGDAETFIRVRQAYELLR